jgi:hypothetical protein
MLFDFQNMQNERRSFKKKRTPPYILRQKANNSNEVPLFLGLFSRFFSRRGRGTL